MTAPVEVEVEVDAAQPGNLGAMQTGVVGDRPERAVGRVLERGRVQPFCSAKQSEQ